MIAEAVDALPAEVDAPIRELAETALLSLAPQHDARDLKQIGKRILDVVAPEVGESHEAAVLAAEEARAMAGVELALVDDGEGRCRGRFTVPSHVGAMLKRHLLALANPARHTEAELRDESGDWKPMRRRLGEAFVEYVIPAVLGTKSEPLDLGRTARLFNRAQRIALGLRDGGCTARGCETTASGCHAHHDDPWSRGGLTDLSPSAPPMKVTRIGRRQCCTAPRSPVHRTMRKGVQRLVPTA